MCAYTLWLVQCRDSCVGTALDFVLYCAIVCVRAYLKMWFHASVSVLPWYSLTSFSDAIEDSSLVRFPTYTDFLMEPVLREFAYVFVCGWSIGQ